MQIAGADDSGTDLNAKVTACGCRKGRSYQIGVRLYYAGCGPRDLAAGFR
jgi:hypothetical protein